MKQVFSRVCMLYLAVSGAASIMAATYDPLSVSKNRVPERLELTVHDAKRDRKIPVRIYLPVENGPLPVVLFSHGLGGSRTGCRYLGEHWAARGYVAVFLQHPGSDESVWRSKPSSERMTAMNGAASTENLLLRVQDVTAVLDQLESWNTNASHALRGCLSGKVGMSGHSFGAVTTQAVSGQSFGGEQKFTDRRICAAIALSPSSPRNGSAHQAFGEVKIPWMLMTGTKDLSPIGKADMDSRLAVYPTLHGAPKYELVLHNALHSAFTDGPLPGNRGTRNPNHHRVILALSTAFWDAYLRDSKDALNWLNSEGPRSVMEESDRWQ